MATRWFFAWALSAARRPTEVTTDRAPVYPRVLDELVPEAWHVMEQYANNPIEADHGRVKARTRPMHRLKRIRCAQVVCSGHAFVQNLRRRSARIGTVLAGVFVAEIGDITRFGKPEQLASWNCAHEPTAGGRAGQRLVPNPVQAWAILAENIFALQRRTWANLTGAGTRRPTTADLPGPALAAPGASRRRRHSPHGGRPPASFAQFRGSPPRKRRRTIEPSHRQTVVTSAERHRDLGARWSASILGTRRPRPRPDTVVVAVPCVGLFP